MSEALDVVTDLPPIDPRASMLHGRSSTPRRGRSRTPLTKYREKSATPIEVAAIARSITPYLRRDEKERTPFELGPNILMQLASYQAIFDKALVMDISGVEEPPAKYIQSEHSVFDRACIMDISNVEYIYIEEDEPEPEEEPIEEPAEEEIEDYDQDDGQEDGGDDGEDENQQDDQDDGQQAEQTTQEQQRDEQLVSRETESPADYQDGVQIKKPPPKRKKLTKKELAAKLAAEEAARIEAEEEARRLAEEAEQRRIEEETAAAIAAAEAAAAAAIAAEEARIEALERAAEEEMRLHPEKVKALAAKREKEYQDALALSRVPHILVHLMDTVVEEGGNVRLACSVTGTDLCVKWYRDGHLLERSDKYHMSESGETICLEIKNTKPADSGEYMCRLHNEYGDTGNSAIVTIYDVVRSQPNLASFDLVRGEYQIVYYIMKIQY